MEFSEILLWRTYLATPRGDHRADYQAASIVQAVYTVAQSLGGGKSKPIKFDECMIKFNEPEKATDDAFDNIRKLKKMFPGVIPDGVLAKCVESKSENG